jgi:hypothetical protein
MLCPHEGFSHEKAVNATVAQAINVFGRMDAALGNDQPVIRYSCQQLYHRVEIGLEGP